MNRFITLISIIAIIASAGIIGFVVYQNYQPIAARTAALSQSVVDFFPAAANRFLATSTSVFPISLLNSSSTNATVEAVPIRPMLEKISTEPVASLTILKLNGATDTLVYIEKKTGNIFSQNQAATTSADVAPTRLSNLTIPAVYEAYFGLNKTKNLQVIVRFPDQNRLLQAISLSISANMATSSSSTTPSADNSPWLIKKTNLSPNIYRLAVSPDKNQVFFLESIGNRSIAYSADWDLQNKKLALVSPYKDWTISWSASNTVYFYPRAGSDYASSLFVLNLKDRSFNKILANLTGLTAKGSPNNQRLVYSNSFGATYSLYTNNLKTNQNNDLYLKTLPEKCLWDSTYPTLYCAVPKNLSLGSYPEDWYLGKTNWNDSLWLVYPDLSKTKLLYDFGSNGQGFDIINLSKDSHNNFYFIDRKTWMAYRLNTSQILGNN